MLPSESRIAPRRILNFTFTKAFLGAMLGCAMILAGARLREAQRPAQSLWRPRDPSFDVGGYKFAMAAVPPWAGNASLDEISRLWDRIGYRSIESIDRAAALTSEEPHLPAVLTKAAFFNYEGQPGKAYDVLQQARLQVEKSQALSHEWLYTIEFSQGVCALRRGENENCILCRGESSCILPIAPEAVHTNPEGSRLAIEHFTAYLRQFPDDLEARWLLNLAHMTLGEYPAGVDPQFFIALDEFESAEADIGRFRDVGHLVGVNRLNQAGGAIMDDFDNDGLLDIVVTSFDPTQAMAIYRNTGDGRFQEVSEQAGVSDQLGGLNCVQADYNNDGRLDIYIPRGAWMTSPLRPTLLRNDGNLTFTDVTAESGLLDPVNSNAAQWADYDNDGWLDLFVCCERQPHRLFHNRRDGTFEETADAAGIRPGSNRMGKGCTWLDYDNDSHPDLFVNSIEGSGQLFHNQRDGTFSEVTAELGIDGPQAGFSCWTWDFDNDGWLDIFATCYRGNLTGCVDSLMGVAPEPSSNRLFRNRNGTRFEDVAEEAGLDLLLATMGSNFGDFDNDGYLDMYLGTGAPNIAMLVPNRMFKNVGGHRFADITCSAGVGHLQKGHGVACGDWDRDGNVDVFIQMGGVINGDKYHNVLFQNPGQGHAWLTMKLVGQTTNRAALGARIKVVTAGTLPLTIHRHVSSGSSFGANPLEQTVGLGTASRVAVLEIYWPTSGTTQVFRDIPLNQAIEITEFSDTYRHLEREPLQLENAARVARAN